MKHDFSQCVDVCLIVEGTYPFVLGGVSGWTHELIRGLPDLTFAVLHVGAVRRSENEIKYVLPDNVRAFAEVFVHETVLEQSRGRGRRAAWKEIERFHHANQEVKPECGWEMLRALCQRDDPAVSVHDALFSRASWELVRDLYDRTAPCSSFLDYFWTWRAVHAPMMQATVAEIPRAHVYHAVCTGYAGLLGAVAKLRTGRPLMLTEHGIYVRERIMDIARSDWLYEEPVRVRVADPHLHPVKDMWRKAFTTLGKITYRACDEIITLNDSNRRAQQELGADPSRQRVLPNGVRSHEYLRVREARGQVRARPRRIGFVGRVVPIKDVKTLLKATALVQQKLDDVALWIVGPTDEDVDYFHECQQLLASLNIQHVEFLGVRKVEEIYPHIDVLVLTSISEGQPLVLLEAACAGVPSVATDVGACRELLEGGSELDRALGPGGIITQVASPEATAEALISLLSSPGRRARMAEAGIARVERFYRQEAVIESYRTLYARYCSEKTIAPMPTRGNPEGIPSVHRPPMPAMAGR